MCVGIWYFYLGTAFIIDPSAQYMNNIIHSLRVIFTNQGQYVDG